MLHHAKEAERTPPRREGSARQSDELTLLIQGEAGAPEGRAGIQAL